MALGVLNNISAIYAQNNLANTQASLSKTLQQLSSGSRINSGADDAAGLSLANGLQASSTALSQSAKNASQGVDFLQVADGALSQVTSLLNRAITLATEASNGTLNASQVSAANSEYQKILTETDTINNNTEYNGINTFAKNSAYSVANASDVVNIGTARHRHRYRYLRQSEPYASEQRRDCGPWSICTQEPRIQSVMWRPRSTRPLVPAWPRFRATSWY